jgi:hypothetical protein
MPTLTEISQQQKDSEEGVLHVEFAMAALNGFLSNPNISMQDLAEIARASWEQADAMIEAMKARRK